MLAFVYGIGSQLYYRYALHLESSCCLTVLGEVPDNNELPLVESRD